MSIFYYPTIKYVYLPDKRLGIMYYSLILVVLFYATVTIVTRKGYLQFDNQPIATLAVRVQDHDLSKSVSRMSHHYCGEQTKNCESVCKCEEWTPLKMVYPPAVDSLSFATFVEEHHRTENASQKFLLEPEKYMIKIDHAIAAPNLVEYEHEGHSDDMEHLMEHLAQEQLGASTRTMKGFLLNSKGKVIKQLRQKKLAALTIGELLEAAGVDKGLDTPSWYKKEETLRRRGVSLHVSIEYSNHHLTLFGTHDIEYFVRVAVQPYMEHTVMELLADGITIRKRSGIRVDFKQSSNIGVFSFSLLLSGLASTAGLLTIVALITDYAALYVFPMKSSKRHSAFMYEMYSEAYTPLVQRESDNKNSNNNKNDTTTTTTRKPVKPQKSE